MLSAYDKLFDTYCEQILRHLHTFPEADLSSFLSGLPLDENTKSDFYDQAQQLYFQWSADAFSIGLHLGLSLWNGPLSGPEEPQ